MPLPCTKPPGSKLTRAPSSANGTSPSRVLRRKTRNESIRVANATSITPIEPSGRRSLTPKPPSELQEINSNKGISRHLGTLGLIAEEKRSAEPSSSLVSPPITSPDQPSDEAGSGKGTTDDRESSGSPELPYIPKLVENVMMPNPDDDHKYDIQFMRMIPDLCAEDYGRMHSIPGLNLFPTTLVVKKKPQDDDWLDRMTFEGCRNREFLEKYTDYEAYLWHESERKRS